MRLLFSNIYLLKENLKIFFGKYLIVLCLNSEYVVINLPRQYYKLNKDNDEIHYIFLLKYWFKSFFSTILKLYASLFKFFFFRLRLKGLGYRIRRMCSRLYRFFFAFNHFFYFHVPSRIYVKHKKRTFMAISNDLVKLNNIFSHLLLLKKLDYYERINAFVVPNKILYLKKKKKI